MTTSVATVAPASAERETPAPGAPAPAKPDYRSERYSARHWLWDNSTARRRVTRPAEDSGADPMRYDHVARHRLCGRILASREAGATIRVKGQGADRSAGWGGLQSCGSVWACPVCSAKIAHERQQEVAEAITRWSKLGGRIVFATFTMRHYKGQRLSTLWDGLADAWNAVGSGAAWVADQKLVGTAMPRVVKSGKRAGETVYGHRVPVIRAAECTEGDNGWHLHLHTLLFFDGTAATDDLARVGAGMWRRWRSGLLAAGLAAPEVPHGFDWREITGDSAADALGDYFAKNTYRASAEVTRGDMKRGRGGETVTRSSVVGGAGVVVARRKNRTPLQVLRDLVTTWSTGELPDSATAEDFDIWSEWERASKGRRQLTWSPGFRDFLGMTAERSDDEIAEDDTGAGDVAVSVPDDVHARIVAARADLLVLRAWERSDAEGWAALARFGLLYDAHETIPAAWAPGYTPPKRKVWQRV